MSVYLFLILTSRLFHAISLEKYQCSGCMTFWCGSGSGSADPCLWLMDPDPDSDPAIFVIDLQDASKKLIFLHNFFCLLLFEGTFTLFFKDKKSKIVGFKIFLIIFAWWKKDPDPGGQKTRGSGSGFGSGSGTLKNTLINHSSTRQVHFTSPYKKKFRIRAAYCTS